GGGGAPAGGAGAGPATRGARGGGVIAGVEPLLEPVEPCLERGDPRARIVRGLPAARDERREQDRQDRDRATHGPVLSRDGAGRTPSSAASCRPPPAGRSRPPSGRMRRASPSRPCAGS